MAHVPTRATGPGGISVVASWQVQSSAADPSPGGTVSQPGYRATGWHDAPARSTVMAALLHNGRFPEVGYSTRLADDVDRSMFEVPWWFRTAFRAVAAPGTRTTIRSDGIIPGADLWVNGAWVAGRDVIAGAYTSNSFDVTHLVHRGDNALAYLVYPGGPMTDLSIGWVDWNQWPPDDNMGIWRDVAIVSTGPARLDHPRVTVTLSPALDAARLVVSVDATNLTTEPEDVTLVITVVGPSEVPDFEPGGGLATARRVQVDLAIPAGAGATERATADVVLSDPAIWWPAGEGAQPMYDLEIVATTGGSVSDRASTSFGVRSVTSDVAPGGGRRFFVNGRSTPIRGGGWCPDLFLRHDPQRIADELAYAADIGLNTIRLEGKGENPEFFERADETGILVLAGWECCNKWEAHAGTGGAAWDDHDFDVAARSMEAEAYRLGNHPSVIGFLVGSDFPPEPRACQLYLEAMGRARWDLPVISSATTEGSDAAWASGMKMTGPYAWVPPVYWYSTDPELGGAVGFNSETSAGNNVPRLASLEKMLSPDDLRQLWSEPSAKQFHSAPPSEFDDLEIFHAALAGRYGPPRSLRDFVAKAQLASYEATRAQFEAYGARTGAVQPATGVVYWMLNSAWPSLNWQLWDHFLDCSGAYFGTKKANEPVHVQYDYDEHAVYILNRTRTATPPFAMSWCLRTVNGDVLAVHSLDVAPVAPAETRLLASVELPDRIPATYFLELDLAATASGATSSPLPSVVSRNVYWLSSTEDVLATESASWQYTPTSVFADLRGLEALGTAQLEVSAETAVADGQGLTTVRIRNPSEAPPALGVHASMVLAGGAPVAPVLWSDNDVVLFAGQSATLSARFAVAAFGAAAPVVEIDGFNVAAPFGVESR